MNHRLKYLKKWLKRNLYFLFNLSVMFTSILGFWIRYHRYAGKIILVFGDMLSYDKGLCNYLNQLSELLSKHNLKLVLLSEAVLYQNKKSKRKLSFPVIKVPRTFSKNYYISDVSIHFPAYVDNYYCKKNYLKLAYNNLTARHNDQSGDFAKLFCFSADYYYSNVLRIFRPYKIILWNKFHALHQIIDSVTKTQNIPAIYMEFGCIPGTIALESLGQMGESYPSVHYKSFRKLPVYEKELFHASRVWDFLKSSKINRNLQVSHSKYSEILRSLPDNKPVLFYAGQNDFESGLYPYTEESSIHHSPIFKSSHEALLYLAELADQNQWTLLYKPHPIMIMLNNVPKNLPGNIILIPDIDINEIIDSADVIITVLSQTGYISCIREKATLMLGYTQLRGKNCAYEAFKKEDIEPVLRKAIKNGFTNEQKSAFLIHLSQMIKYYLFDDLTEKKINYGQSIEKALEAIVSK